MSPRKHEPDVGDEAAGQRPAASLCTGKRLFRQVELRLFRYTAVVFSLVSLAALIGAVVWTFGQMMSFFYNLLLSLSLAGILALVLCPVVRFLERRVHLPRVVAVLLILLTFFVAIGALLFFLVPTLVRQAVQLMTVVPETLERMKENFDFSFPEISAMISEGMNSNGDEESESIVENTGSKMVSYLGLLAGLGFVPLFLFFALMSGHSVRDKASELLSVFQNPTQNKVLYFMDVFVGYITAFFQGQLIIAICMGGLYALGFTLIGLEFGVLAGLILGLLNIVPFLGTAIGLVVILPMAYLQNDGGVQLLLFALLAFAAVQLVESWLLTPKIMADRSGLHPALVVISLFFWGTALGGVIGMVLAVPLTAFFVAIWGEIKTSLEHALSSEDASQ